MSTITGLAMRGGVLFITLTFPAEVVNSQRRYFVRVAPGLDMVQDLQVWHASQDSLPEGKNACDTADLKPHDLRWTPLNQNDVRVKDISAGGIGLTFTGEEPIAKGDYFIISFSYTTAKHKSVPVIVMGCCARCLPDPEINACHAGIRFTYVRRSEDNAKVSVWKALTATEGLSFLSSWILSNERKQHRTKDV